MKNYLRKQTSKVYRNRAILTIIACAIVACFLINNLQGGALKYRKIKSDSDITKDMAGDNTKFVEFTDAEIFYTGYYYTYDGQERGKYFLVKIEDRYILSMMPLKVAEEIEVHSFKGKLRQTDSVDKDVIKNFRNYLVSEYDDWTMEDATAAIPDDYMIDATDSGGLIGFYVQVVLTSILAIYAINNIILAIEPRFGRKYKEFKRYGDIEMLEETINQDIEDENKYYDSKYYKIMKNYSIMSTGLNIKIYKTNEIMWIYKLIIRNSYNGVPTGKTYALDVRFNTNAKTFMRIPMKKEFLADEAIEQLQARLPGVIYGFPPELQNNPKSFDNIKEIWEKNKENLGQNR